MRKPTVNYNVNHTYRYPEVGCRAIIYPMDGVFLGEMVVTTRVVRVDGDDFETKNTIYVGVHK